MAQKCRNLYIEIEPNGLKLQSTCLFSHLEPDNKKKVRLYSRRYMVVMVTS